jgi:hypothetical protein
VARARGARFRPLVVLGLALLAACGAEAVFLIAIANSWSAQSLNSHYPDRSFNLAASESGEVHAADLTGDEILGNSQYALTGSFTGQAIHFTVNRPDSPDDAACAGFEPCSPDCPCHTADFSGRIETKDRIHVTGGGGAGGVEEYVLTRPPQ